MEGVRGSLKARKARAVAVFSALTAWCLATGSPSLALKAGGPSDFSLGGNATVVHPGNGSPTAAELSSTPGSESHVNIAIPDDLKLRQLSNVSTDYKFVEGSCHNGSPRFTANLRNGTSRSSVFFYIGCASGDWANTGNLAAPNSLVDTGQLPGGAGNQPYSQVQAAFGNFTVTAMHIDVDGAVGGNQTVDFDNTIVNQKFVTYEPQHGISVLVERTAGTIKIKEPGKRAKKGFKNFKKVESVRVNSLVDTRAGKVVVTAATGNFGDTSPDQSVALYDGLIRLTQKRGRNARATARLAGKLQCPGNAAQAKAGKSGEPLATTSRRRGRRVWGSGSGNYNTSGEGGTGSVRGTTWLTKDTCRGTFFKVTEGIGITVHDFDLNRSVDLGPGQSYFARNR
jgi:hypothetical protein